MDTLYHNGTVITMERPLRAEAVLVRNGRIAAVGAAAELRAQAQGPLRSADLKGCTLLPAFVDAHSHFAAAASRFLEISLAGCRTPEEIVARLSEHLRLHPVPPGQWVRAGGYDHNFVLTPKPGLRLAARLTGYNIDIKPESYRDPEPEAETPDAPEDLEPEAEA